MRVLITGSEGYIGTILSPYLLAHGHDVAGIDTGFHRVVQRRGQGAALAFR
jgi:nucleoside-diphosphate-sugar epimerase